MQYFQFLGHLNKKLSPVYLFYGEEDFLKEEAMERLEEILRQKKGVEEKEFFEEGVNGGVLMERFLTTSLLGKPALIVIKNTKALDEKCRDLLFKYIKNPTATNYLIVFLDKDEDIKKWGEPHFFIEFKKFYERDFLNWLMIRSGDNKKILSKDVAEIFLDRIGLDLALLSKALERVIDYIGSKRVIQREDIEEILGDERKDAVFELTDALASQDLSTCLSILNRLLLSFTPPGQIIGLLSWQIRQLYTLKKGWVIDLPPFVLNRLKENARRFTAEKLEGCLQGLRIVDSEIKNGLMNPRLSLELFFFKFLESGEAKTGL